VKPLIPHPPQDLETSEPRSRRNGPLSGKRMYFIDQATLDEKLAAARREALEEAARVADDFSRDPIGHRLELETAKDIAAAIRERSATDLAAREGTPPPGTEGGT
jgi:hypothetical protein